MTYHKFVNTTPKPKATKKSNGELGPPPPSERPELVAAAGDVDVTEAIAEVEDMMKIKSRWTNELECSQPWKVFEEWSSQTLAESAAQPAGSQCRYCRTRNHRLLQPRIQSLIGFVRDHNT